MASISRSMGVPSDQPQGAYYTVAIAQGGFLSSSGDNLGGGVSPKNARDHGTKPTTLVISQMLSRGNLRYEKMLEFLQIRSNVRGINLVTNSDVGDTQLTSLAFGLVFENDDYIPSSSVNFGTDIAGTAYSTKVNWIKDKIGEALTGPFTENITVYDPTGSNFAAIKTEFITAGPVSTASGEVVEAIAVAEVAAFRSNVDAETPTDSAATSTAE